MSRQSQFTVDNMLDMEGRIDAECKQREIVIYAFAHVEAWLEDYSKSTFHNNQAGAGAGGIGISAHELTERVANLLLAQTSRAVVGTEHRVPNVRPAPAKGVKAARKVAVDGGTRNEVQRVTGKTAAKGKLWRQMTGKPHWTQTAAGRKKNRKALRAMQRAFREKYPKAA